MIAFLHGKVLALEESAVVLDVGGVGYRVHVPLPTLADVGPVGAVASVHTYLHVRENELELYGAADADTLALFKLLLGVSGVGPKLALAMLSAIDAPTLQRAIVAEDLNRLTEVPGVGRKTAQRMVLDLKTKLIAAGVTPDLRGGVGLGGATGLTGVADDEALGALLALGYTRGEARRALAAANLGAEATVEERIRAALRELAG